MVHSVMPKTSSPLNYTAFASGTFKHWWICIALCIVRYIVYLPLADRAELNVGNEDYVHIYKHTHTDVYIYIYIYI
jgi:hypothetical protein